MSRTTKKATAKVPQKPYIAGATNKLNGISSLSGLSKGIPANHKIAYAEGDRVEHVKYGVGTVAKIEKGARDYKVTVNFDEVGPKVMFAAFAKLKKL